MKACIQMVTRHVKTLGYGVLVVLALCVVACASTPPSKTPGRPIVICATVPVYCFASAIAGDLAEVQLLPHPNIGPHDYQLTLKDKDRVLSAQLLIFSGLGLSGAMSESVLREFSAAGVEVLDATRDIPRSFLIAMAEHGHANHDHAGHDHQHGSTDPHVWLCREGALGMARSIHGGLIRVVRDASAMQQRFEALNARLDRLFDEAHTRLEKAKSANLVTFHEAWAYFSREFGFTVSAVVLPTLEGQTGFRHYESIVNTIRSNGIRAIFVEPQFTQDAARAIAEQAGCKLAVLDPCETTNLPLSPDIYFERMQENIAALESVLMTK